MSVKVTGLESLLCELVRIPSPTPPGEGKTTTTVGLGDALNRIGKKAMVIRNDLDGAAAALKRVRGKSAYTSLPSQLLPWMM